MNKSEIRRVCSAVKPTTFMESASFVKAIFMSLKEHYGRYSYTKFAEDFGFGACNTLYLVAHEQRQLSVKGAQKFITLLAIKGAERRYLLNLVDYESQKDFTKRKLIFDQLISLKAKALPSEIDRKHLEFFSHWYHAAILELLSLEQVSDDPEWISKKLVPAITPKQAEKSIALLKRLGYLVFDEDKKRCVPSRITLSTGAEVYGMAVVTYHQQMIELAKESITTVDPDERDISSVIISTSDTLRSRIKEEIIAFRQKLLELSREDQAGNEINQINIQFFPVTKEIEAVEKESEK